MSLFWQAEINAPPARVRDCLTDPALLPRWMEGVTAAKAEGDGFYLGGPADIGAARLTEAEGAVSWHFEHGGAVMETRFELQPSGEGCRLEVTRKILEPGIMGAIRRLALAGSRVMHLRRETAALKALAEG
jgi:uncharacterized protein YndB with AHSA1/START domain